MLYIASILSETMNMTNAAVKKMAITSTIALPEYNIFSALVFALDI
jgi:hypothetical protein